MADREEMKNWEELYSKIYAQLVTDASHQLGRAMSGNHSPIEGMNEARDLVNALNNEGALMLADPQIVRAAHEIGLAAMRLANKYMTSSNREERRAATRLMFAAMNLIITAERVARKRGIELFGKVEMTDIMKDIISSTTGTDQPIDRDREL